MADNFSAINENREDATIGPVPSAVFAYVPHSLHPLRAKLLRHTFTDQSIYNLSAIMKFQNERFDGPGSTNSSMRAELESVLPVLSQVSKTFRRTW